MERTCELIKQAKEGNKEAQSILVEENSGLIWSVVKRFQGRGYDKEDLFQIGSIGLLKCIENFDLERNVKFSTYAVPLIMGEIKRFLRDDGIVKVSRSLKEASYKIKREKEHYQKLYNREPTLKEIAVTLDMDESDILMAMESGQEVCSLHQVIYQSEGDEIHLEDKLEQQADLIEQTVDNIYVQELLKKLNEQERQIIHMRYFQNQTQAAIATRIVDFGMFPQDAVAAPRWLHGRTWGAASNDLKMEGRISQSVLDELKKRGHPVAKLDDVTDSMGHAGAILIDPATNLRYSATDPRGDGLAVGY